MLTNPKKALGFVEIKLKDVVQNTKIKDVFDLHQAKQGQLVIELTWLKH